MTVVPAVYVRELEKELAEARAETVELKKGAESDTGTILRQANSIRVMGEELSDARAEIERLKEGRNFWRNKCEVEESEAGKAMIRYVCQEQDKDSLIEQMWSALKIVKAHMHKTGDFYAIDDVNAALSAAERGE